MGCWDEQVRDEVYGFSCKKPQGTFLWHTQKSSILKTDNLPKGGDHVHMWPWRRLIQIGLRLFAVKKHP
ncbi:hypothetical protein GCM10008938_33580 [Deinococcus roseus]|uniref:Uncharacterized protein n=1 Tax=Deinococcus roseus TaxID=392414 RepID=A0ABQ2D3H3_9DEIO|nr:hypothetical protein GCM10008938_33580 [Deinococcus roseus]